MYRTYSHPSAGEMDRPERTALLGRCCFRVTPQQIFSLSVKNIFCDSANHLRFRIDSQLKNSMSLQITILKVLSSHADGRSSLASLNNDIAILAKSGREWTDRVKRLASRASSVDLFGSGYIVRDQSGWQITGDGRHFLAALESDTRDPRLPNDLLYG